MAAPSNEEEYCEWAKATVGVDFRSAESTANYDLNLSAALTQVQESKAWAEIPKALATLSQHYKADHKAPLFLGPVPELTLQKKPYSSVINKTFRKNILWNNRYPDSPKTGWISNATIYSDLDDLLRTTIVCTFLDGPGLITSEIKRVCDGFGTPSEIRVLSREEGYYGHHIYIKVPVDLAIPGKGIQKKDLQVEIQVTTQPQELLRTLTHPYYVEQRSQGKGVRDQWQWDYNTNKFKARYLSHSLHLLEALILQVRDTPDKDNDG